MIKLRVLDILQEKGKSKYWLYKQLGMTYQNFNRMVNNETISIKYEVLDQLLKILDCRIEDLFQVSDDPEPAACKKI